MEHVSSLFQKLEQNQAKDLESLATSRFNQEAPVREDLAKKKNMSLSEEKKSDEDAMHATWV